MGHEQKDYPFELEVSELSNTGFFKGFASVFGGRPDSYGDIVIQGAFLKSISQGGRNKNGVVMLKHHNRTMIPGVWTNLIENSKGLVAEGQLLMDTQLGRETHAELKAGALKGMSIGFRTLVEEFVQQPNKTTVRYVKEVDLFEISLVAFPAHTRATVTSVKEAIELASTEREMEDSLRELGLSQRAAQYVVSLVDMDLRDLDPEEGKPYPNEHACRLKDTANFVRFSRKNNAGKVDGKRIDYIIGFKKGGGSDIQSIRYPKAVWEASAAKAHCSGKGGSFEAAKKEAIKVIGEKELYEILSELKGFRTDLQLSRLKGERGFI